ncbi:MAG: bifunctional hydroxymethylpyrimidine kinase/phosphomethylpyrimidine kinase [Pseudomonadota bacterium]
MSARILSIAGSDSGGGAGIQADIKTACAFGVYASTAITAVTAQNTLTVTRVEALAPTIVSAQIDAVLSDIGADAIKIGMLANVDICKAVGSILEGVSVPIVLDPVMISTSGSKLLDEKAINIVRDHLVPRATLVTPNLPEMDVLGGLSDPSRNDRLARATEFAKRFDIAVLLKDGHGNGEMVEDALITQSDVEWFSSPRLASINTHGTGCALSTAVACGLAKGETLRNAVKAGRDFVYQGIKSAPGLGAGHGPLNFIHKNTK